MTNRKILDILQSRKKGTSGNVEKGGKYMAMWEDSIIERKIINITGKRQITIPLRFYEKLNFGKEIECFLTDDAVVIRPLATTGDNVTMDILKDLVVQGYSGYELLEKFAAQRQVGNQENNQENNQESSRELSRELTRENYQESSKNLLTELPKESSQESLISSVQGQNTSTYSNYTSNSIDTLKNERSEIAPQKIVRWEDILKEIKEEI